MVRTFPFMSCAALIAAAPAAGGMQPVRSVQPVQLTASDGITVTGRFYPAAKPKAIVLLFHQAGSSKDEYATIAPRLAVEGYDALAIDQRSGGDLFGPNDTAKRLKGRQSFESAQRDLDAAVRWAQRRGERIILWGSSYSAALVFRVAAAHPTHVTAVLAFSPGEYLAGPPSVAASAAHVQVPVFVTSASASKEIAAVRTILSSVRSRAKTQFVPTMGVHGSATLIQSRNPQGAQANWRAVDAFLKKVAP